MEDTDRALQCPLCGQSVTGEALYCSRCGQRLGQTVPATDAARAKWYHNVWLVLFVLFFILGPFGLPLVWKSPRFSRWVKVALTGAMVLYTLLFVSLVMQMARAVRGEIDQLNTAIPF